MTPVQHLPAGEPERTPDGHHVIINGRRWRATDPEIPDADAALLRRELMTARRAVGVALKAGDREAERAARDRVQRAKVALGERGTPWWEQNSEQRRDRWAVLVKFVAATPVDPVAPLGTAGAGQPKPVTLN